MYEELFELPKFHYFKEKNLFTGSVDNYFNYKIWFGEEFTVKVWYGSNCFSKTPSEEIKAEFTAKFSPEGLEKIRAWLGEQYAAYKDK